MPSLIRSTRTTAIPRRRSSAIRSVISRIGATRIPRTRCSSNSARCATSRSAVCALLPTCTAYPAAWKWSSAPSTTSVKNGLAMSITTMPTDRLRPARSWRADSLRTQPSLSIACRTRSWVAGDTRSGELSTFETVPTDTPASVATSFMLTELRATTA